MTRETANPPKHSPRVFAADLHDAVVGIAKRHGVEATAKRLGQSLKIFSKKLHETDGRKLSAREAEAIADMHDDPALAESAAAARGMILVKLPDFSNVSDVELLEHYTRLMSKIGDYSRVFHDAIKDGRITGEEIVRMENMQREAMAAFIELTNRARTLVKPELKAVALRTASA